MPSKTKVVSIGFVREDGDFQVLATLNNQDDIVPADKFKGMIDRITKTFIDNGVDVVTLFRQDTPDYLDLSALDLVSVKQI